MAMASLAKAAPTPALSCDGFSGATSGLDSAACACLTAAGAGAAASTVAALLRSMARPLDGWAATADAGRSAGSKAARAADTFDAGGAAEEEAGAEASNLALMSLSLDISEAGGWGQLRGKGGWGDGLTFYGPLRVNL